MSVCARVSVGVFIYVCCFWVCLCAYFAFPIPASAILSSGSIDHCKTTPSVSQAHTYIPQVWCMGSVAAEWLLLKRNPRGSLVLFIQQHFILSLWLWLRKGSTRDFFPFLFFFLHLLPQQVTFRTRSFLVAFLFAIENVQTFPLG